MFSQCNFPFKVFICLSVVTLVSEDNVPCRLTALCLCLNTNFFLVELFSQASNLVLLPVKCLKELGQKWNVFVGRKRRNSGQNSSRPTVFLPHLALSGGRWSLCRFAAVWGAAVRPQRDVGLVWLPHRQITEVSGVLGVLVGQLLLNESLRRDDQLVYTTELDTFMLYWIYCK